MELPLTALVATPGQGKHDAIAVPVDVASIQHLVVDLQNQIRNLGIDDQPCYLDLAPGSKLIWDHPREMDRRELGIGLTRNTRNSGAGH